MSEPIFASLNPSLLARKGAAKPAMRPQHGLVPTPSLTTDPLEDLGWNDMGAQEEASENTRSAPRTNETASIEPRDNVVSLDAENEVHRQQSKLAATVEASIAEFQNARPRRSALSRGKRAAFTLRLDAERHLKLRLVSTVSNRSAQQIVTEALDRFLAGLPEIEALAAQLAKK